MWRPAARRERHPTTSCGARTAYMAWLGGNWGDRLWGTNVVCDWLRGTSHLWDATATLVCHQVAHLFYVILGASKVLGASEVRIVIRLSLWTRGAEIYVVAKVDQPFDDRPS